MTKTVSANHFLSSLNACFIRNYVAHKMSDDLKTYQKNKGGRPEKEVKRNALVSVRFTKNEKQALKYIAKKENENPSEFLRNIALKKIGLSVRKKPNEEIQNLRNDLRRLGVNINQIAKQLNTNNQLKSTQISMFEITLKELFKTLMKIK